MWIPSWTKRYDINNLYGRGETIIGTKTRVFSTKSVTQEEESLLREEVWQSSNQSITSSLPFIFQGRIVSSKMLAIDPSLLKLLSYHQFRYLVFPCWQLPMEIPPRPWLDRGMAGPLYTTQNAAVVRYSYHFLLLIIPICGKNQLWCYYVFLRNLPEFPKVDMGYEMRNRLKHKWVRGREEKEGGGEYWLKGTGSTCIRCSQLSRFNWMDYQ